MTVMNGDDPGNAPRELRESTKTHLSHYPHIIHTPSPPVNNEGGSYRYPVSPSRPLDRSARPTHKIPHFVPSRVFVHSSYDSGSLACCEPAITIPVSRPLVRSGRPFSGRLVPLRRSIEPLNPTTGRAAAAHRTGGLEN